MAVDSVSASLVVDTPAIKIYKGMAQHWHGSERIDFVFTNPYGALPWELFRTPMVIHQWDRRHVEAERWCGNRLNQEVGRWNRDQEVFWATNFHRVVTVDIHEFVPEMPGWYPEAMVRRLFDAFQFKPGSTVWDGFMGRGTVAKIARERGINYVGVEMLDAHIALAKTYLSLNS